MEWLNLRQLFTEVLEHFGLSASISLDCIAFSWTYDTNIAAKLYKPSAVFKNFSFVNLFDENSKCMCLSASRLRPFLDPLTTLECSNYCKSAMHVRSMDVKIIQHPILRAALMMGMNHIPLRPTDFNEAINVTVDAFVQLYSLLALHDYNLDLPQATAFLKQSSLSRLRFASRINKFGFKSSEPFIFSIPAVNNEVEWLLSHLFISGLDKASQNACFLCIRHIRMQAYDRLMGTDFSPCQSSGMWSLPTAIFDTVKDQLLSILPEAPPTYSALPFLMATFKQHKLTYRWLTNAHHTVYTQIATLLTVTSNAVLETFKSWARRTEDGYCNILRTNTSIFWIIDSVMHVTLNMPEKIHDIYVADMTRCYETIPLEGDNNLLDALKFVIRHAYREAARQHPIAVNTLWVKISSKGLPTLACWHTTQPRSGCWIPMPQDRVISLHAWLISHCFVVLGDRVWKQVRGIPMGFSCSPIWCNLYLLAYEVQFIQRLPSLGRTDLLSKFQFAFRYIDDLCWFNVMNPQDFLSPDQPRVPSNPYWIYPLHILEIKPEITEYATDNPTQGISAHFLNLQIHVDTEQPGQFSMSKFDKRRDLPFHYTQFIKFQSNRPVKQAYNIIISQVLSILYISNCTVSAVSEINLLIRTMMANGFQERRLRQSIIAWLKSGRFPSSRVNIQQTIQLLNRYFKP
jgi:hypothetical protein